MDVRKLCVFGWGGLACWIALLICVGAFERSDVASAQTPPVIEAPAPMETVFKVVTDGKGEVFLHEPVMQGERVEFSIVYRGVGDEGIPDAVDVSYPLVVFYTFEDPITQRMREKIFDYSTSKIRVEDGIIYAGFEVPKGITVLTVKWAVEMTGGSDYWESADRDWASLIGKNDDKTQTIQIKMLVKK